MITAINHNALENRLNDENVENTNANANVIIITKITIMPLIVVIRVMIVNKNTNYMCIGIDG